MSRKHSKQDSSVKKDNGKTFVNVKQGANATINQGGDAFAINATEVGVVCIRPGQQ